MLPRAYLRLGTGLGRPLVGRLFGPSSMEWRVSSSGLAHRRNLDLLPERHLRFAKDLAGLSCYKHIQSLRRIPSQFLDATACNVVAKLP